MTTRNHHETGSKRDETLDFVIIGAGVSGINMAHYIRTRAPSGTTYAIFESRGQIGGTWDLFRYPGVRSDSDMHTFGFSWNPWRGERTVATGGQIREYLRDSAEMAGAKPHIRFHHHVLAVNWSSSALEWTVDVQTDEKKEPISMRARFVVLGTGYYDYHEPMQATVPGLENFEGDIIHPQFWPEDYSYANKKVAIVGSGATAITLLPSMAGKAEHVTMVQRSPSYIAAIPVSRGIVNRVLGTILPSVAASFTRLHFIFTTYWIYYSSRRNPKAARTGLLAAAAKQLPPDIPVDPHFTPRYNPWDQRLCISPEGDFYTALRSGKASITTGTIDCVTGKEMIVSGEKLPVDVIVRATGLKLKFAGGIRISIDGTVIDPANKFAWRGCMLQDVPNLAFVIGYMNASWTLGAETTGVALMRLWRRMLSSGKRVARPTLESDHGMAEVSLFGISSTYVQNADCLFPKGGNGPWAWKNNYLVDTWNASWGDLSTGVVLE